MNYKFPRHCEPIIPSLRGTKQSRCTEFWIASQVRNDDANIPRNDDVNIPRNDDVNIPRNDDVIIPCNDDANTLQVSYQNGRLSL